MSQKIYAVSEHSNMEQPQRYIVTSNEEFIKNFPERAIKSIEPATRVYNSIGKKENVYVGKSFTDEILFEVSADSVNVEYHNTKLCKG